MPNSYTLYIRPADDLLSDRDGPAIQISGSTWTPNVDESNNVYTSDYPQLTLNTPYYIATNTIDDVWPTPRYPDINSNPDGSDSIVNGWSGAAWDYVRKRMYINGGGHGDSHPSDNGWVMLDLTTMQFSMAIGRSATSSARYLVGTTYTSGVNANGHGVPDAEGRIPCAHTYDGLCFIPGSEFGNTNGALFFYNRSRGVYDLDTETWDTPHFDLPDSTNYAYAWAEPIGGLQVVMPWNGSIIRRFNIDTRTATWYSDNPGGVTLPAADSRGAFETAMSSSTIPYAAKAKCSMRERGEFVVFGYSAGTPYFKRVRFQDAVDASEFSDWSSYMDTITLTSSDDSHLDFSESNLTDTGGVKVLCSAGMAYDHANSCIWVAANYTTGRFYKITGLDGSEWTTSYVGSENPLTDSDNGTYGRWQVAAINGTTVCVRVSATTDYAQIMRVA